MATAHHAEQSAPMMDVNTTPLIDVMLVLLIMFIITIPIQTHSVKLDLPETNSPPTQPDPLKNKLVITQAGGILWNGSSVDMVRLRQYLEMTQKMRPVPELQLEPDAQAPYALVDRVMAATKRARVDRMGFVGNERYVTAF